MIYAIETDDRSSNDTIVITHGGCPDGHTAAWLLNFVFPRATFVGARHGDRPPEVPGKHVVIADFAFRRPVTTELLDQCASMIVLDHHQTALEDLDGLRHPRLTQVFDMNRCGSRIVLDHYADRLEPALGSERFASVSQFVQYIDDRDRWVKALPWSDEWSAGLGARELTFDSWDEVAFAPLSDLIQQGSAIARYLERRVEAAVGRAVEATIGGHSVLVSNCDPSLVSEVGGRLAIGRPFSACYIDQDDGRTWSLRSTPEGVDVARFAQQFGGGGHPRAAGFRTARDSWPPA